MGTTLIYATKKMKRQKKRKDSDQVNFVLYASDNMDLKGMSTQQARYYHARLSALGQGK